MFRSARFKLTATYLVIIMLISSLFSLVIYMGFNYAIDKRLNRLEHGLRPPEEKGFLHKGLEPSLVLKHIESAKSRALLFLLYANGLILVLFASAGYYFAGKTLKPIENSLEEQKRFVADASHELRTPLTALKTSIEVALRNKTMTIKGARKVLRESLDDVDDLQALSSNLLSLAQYQDTKNNLQFKQVNVKDVIGNAYKKVQPLAKEKKIEINIEANNLSVEADKASIEKAIVILLDNAIKYNKKGGKVFVRAKHDKRHLFLEVQDTGIGIAKENMPHIYERFYRVKASRSKTKIAGFGLGLSMLKKIIDLHKGSIEVSSIIKKGTTFTVKIPIKHP